MDRPGRRDDRLLIAHDDVTGLLRLAHVVHDKGIFRKVKVEIDFHTSVMSMAGHCVPDTAGFQMGHAHLQLAALDLSGQDVFVDRSVVGILQCTQFFLVYGKDLNIIVILSLRVLQDTLCGIGHVSGTAAHIEFCRIRGICAGKGDLF